MEAVYVGSSLDFRTDKANDLHDKQTEFCSVITWPGSDTRCIRVCVSSNNTSLHTISLTTQLQYLLTSLPILHCSVPAYVKANWTLSSNPVYSSQGIRWWWKHERTADTCGFLAFCEGSVHSRCPLHQPNH